MKKFLIIFQIKKERGKVKKAPLQRAGPWWTRYYFSAAVFL